MNKATALILAATFWACGERVDELTPYVQQMEKMNQYNETLARYSDYLKNPALERQARNIKDVIQKYNDEMETFGAKDKYIRSGHNVIKRALARALKQIVEPDFPTFTVSAQKQINVIHDAVLSHHEYLEKQWSKAEKTEPFPLKWPE